MAVELILNKLKKLVLVVFGLIKRSLCCFKRRRRSSCETIPLTGVGIGSSNHGVQNNDIENWSWEDPTGIAADPNSVQYHIEMYRQQGLRAQPEPEEEPQPDFFEDMTPKIIKQTKVKLSPQNHEQDAGLSSRLNFVPEVVPTVGPELGSWEETEGQGSWEEAEDWNVTQLVREKRRAEREKQAAMKRDHSRTTLGSKVR